MTFYCVPSGATLLQNGQLMGGCPTTVAYPVSGEARRAGTLTTLPVTARWPSGASVTVPALSAPLASGFAQHYTFVRPVGVAGAEMDYQVGADTDARIAAQQGQIAAQQAQTGFALGQLLGQALAK